jgi:transposase-like protein
VLQQLTKRLLESALDGEITDHLGHDKHDPAGRGTGNSRNGIRAKIHTPTVNQNLGSSSGYFAAAVSVSSR